MVLQEAFHHFGESELVRGLKALRGALRRLASAREGFPSAILRAADEHVKEMEALKKVGEFLVVHARTSEWG